MTLMIVFKLDNSLFMAVMRPLDLTGINLLEAYYCSSGRVYPWLLGNTNMTAILKTCL